MVILVLGLVSFASWIFLLCARGGFWNVSKHLRMPAMSSEKRRLVIVIPARNEADGIGPALKSIFKQNLEGLTQVIVVDDNSTDGTGAIATNAVADHTSGPPLKVIRGEPLAAGWTGKLWALQQGIAEAERLTPEYFLLTDADIVHAPREIGRLISVAEGNGLDLASYMVKLSCESFAERALIPAFVFFFLMVYPPGKVPGAAGGCILIRRAALERIGGMAAIRDQVIDDCALAKAVSQSGGKTWLGLARETRSGRSYETFWEIGRMISRTAFNQLQHSAWLLVGTTIGLLVTYVLPVVLLCTGNWLWMGIGVLTWAMMTAAYLPTIRFYRLPWPWALTLPVVACFYLGATVHSAMQYWRGKGGEWKGRVQDRKPASDLSK